MEQIIHSDVVENEKQIEFVKQWVVDLYETGVFYSFSLYTLELSRRFNNCYVKFRNTNSPADFRDLLDLTEKLEKKLIEELQEA